MRKPQTLCEAWQATAATDPNAVALRAFDGSAVTGRDYGQRVEAIAGGLSRLGVQRGDTVALMLTNRPEFHFADAAVMHLGATPFSLYNSNSPEQLSYLLSRAGSRVAICEKQFFDPLRAASSAVEHLLVVEDGDLDALRPEPGFNIEAAWRAVTPDDVLTLIYTAGTTGPPKGVEITHANGIAQLASLTATFNVRRGDRTISFLLSAHIADRMISHYCNMSFGTELTCVADMKTIAAALADVHPTVWAAVPRIWEKLKMAVDAQLQADPALSAAFDAPDPKTLAGVRASFGLDQLRWALAGASAIAPDVQQFFLALGVPVCEVWGMTELPGIAAGSGPDEVKPGTVGRLLPGFQARLGEDGELLLRGGSTMQGYRDDPECPAQAFDAEGWLCTGDIVTRDEEGYFRIVDRKTELIINAGGKNMSPASIQNEIASASPLIAYVMAVGDNRPYNVALLTLDPDAAAGFAARLGLVPDPAVLAEDERVIAAVQAGVDAGNAKLSRVEQVHKFAILPAYWEPGGTEITPTMKLRRRLSRTTTPTGSHVCTGLTEDRSRAPHRKPAASCGPRRLF